MTKSEFVKQFVLNHITMEKNLGFFLLFGYRDAGGNKDTDESEYRRDYLEYLKKLTDDLENSGLVKWED